jgi:uncharacterized C2H2 Zn-finger protein
MNSQHSNINNTIYKPKPIIPTGFFPTQLRPVIIARHRRRQPTKRQLKIVRQLSQAFGNLRSVLSEIKPEDWNAINEKNHKIKDIDQNFKNNDQENKDNNEESKEDSDATDANILESSKTIRTFCDDCKLHFSTTSNFTRHLRSVKHVEAMKEKARNMQLVQTGPFSFGFTVNTRKSSSDDESEAKKPKISMPDLNWSNQQPSLSSSIDSSDSGFSSQDSFDDLVKSFKYPPIELTTPEPASEPKFTPNAAKFSIEALLRPSENRPSPSHNIYVEKKCKKVCLDDGRKLFHCHLCPKVFASNSNLRRHENLHGRGKIQRCPVCGKTFMQKEYLKKHLVVHERGSETVMF